MHLPFNISVNKAIRILLTYLFFVSLSESLFVPIIAVFIKDFIAGATLSTVGFAVAIFAVTKSIIQVPLAKFLDKKGGEYDDFYALMAGAFLTAFYPFLFLAASKPWHLYGIEIISGVGAAFLMAAYYSIFSRHVDKGAEAFEWSLFSVGGITTAYAIGSAAGGIMADLIGFDMLFLLSGVINLLVLLVLFYLYPLLDKGSPKNPVPQFSPLAKPPHQK